MNAIKTKISGVEVLIQVEENNNSLKNNVAGKSGRTENKSKEIIVEKAFDKATKVMLKLAESCIKQFKEKENAPNEIEIEYGLSFNASANIWAITMGTNSNINVKMKWNKE